MGFKKVFDSRKNAASYAAGWLLVGALMFVTVYFFVLEGPPWAETRQAILVAGFLTLSIGAIATYASKKHIFGVLIGGLMMLCGLLPRFL